MVKEAYIKNEVKLTIFSPIKRKFDNFTAISGVSENVTKVCMAVKLKKLGQVKERLELTSYPVK